MGDYVNFVYVAVIVIVAALFLKVSKKVLFIAAAIAAIAVILNYVIPALA